MIGHPSHQLAVMLRGIPDKRKALNILAYDLHNIKYLRRSDITLSIRELA